MTFPKKTNKSIYCNTITVIIFVYSVPMISTKLTDEMYINKIKVNRSYTIFVLFTCAKYYSI